MQFGAKPLFSDVSVKSGGGNRYGLIGANGCAKSALMKILGGELEPSAGVVAIDSNKQVGWLRQDQFADKGRERRSSYVFAEGCGESIQKLPKGQSVVPI